MAAEWSSSPQSPEAKKKGSRNAPPFSSFADFLGVHTAALFIFLAGAAGTRIVWPHFFRRAHALHRSCTFSATRHPRLFQFPFLLALELALHVVHGRACPPKR